MKKLLFTLIFTTGTLMYVHSQESLNQYAGKYNFPEGSAVREIIVIVENNTLQIGSLVGTASLIKESDDNFTIPAFNGLAIFKRDSNKKITNIFIDLMGLKLDGIKEADTSANQSGSSDKPIIIIWDRKLLTSP